MAFAWRREDSGYLAAACAAAAVVVYLVIGNFGLLPSPFAGPRPNSIFDGIEPVLVTQPAPVDVEIPPVPAPVPDNTPITPPGGPSVSGDGAAPTITMATEPGTQFAVTEPATVEGLVRDTGSGVKDVLVAFTATNGETVVPATVSCDDAGRRICFWRAKVPVAVAAGYTVKATGTDRAGNAASSKAIDLTVVNPGGTVGQVTDAVERVPNVLDKLVGPVLGVLGAGS